jgi:hypothetical protein
MIKTYPFLFIFFVIVFSQNIFGQNTYFVSSPIIRKDEFLTEFIKDKYNENKKEVCEECSSKEKQIINSILLRRKERTISMIEKGNLILSGPLFDFVNSIYNEIAIANPQINRKKIIILKDESANAFTMGEDIIYIHTGLLYRLQNKDQLAYILCHELGHDELEHYYSDLKNYAKEKTEKERKIKEIMSKKYGHVTNLNEFLVPKLLANMKSSREDELTADSLGVIFYQNCRFDKAKACTSFDIFLEADHIRDTSIFDFKKELLLSDGLIDMNKLTSYSNESSLGDFDDESGLTDAEIEQQKKLNDMLRSHPYEAERSLKLYSYFNLEVPEEFNTKIDIDYSNIRYFSEGEMILYCFQNQQIGKALFYAMNMNRNYPSDSYSNEAKALSMLALYYYKNSFKEGIAIENQDEENDIAYDKLIFFLKKLSPDECFKIGKNLFESQDKNSKSIESKVIKLLIFHKELRNEDFKTLYLINEEVFKSSVYWKIVNTMFLEVNKRL